ncbi:MAG: hypothetical protein QW177_03210 [Candidatus Nitrosotenuis sp.]
MGQFFTDDIDALLKANHGDAQRLAKIKADFESKKLVTIEDRRYVEGLVSRYLQPSSKPETERIVKIPEKKIVPPPTPQPARTSPFELKYQQKPKEEKPIPKIGGDKTKLRNIVIAVCSAVFAVLAISFVAMNQDALTPPESTQTAEGLELDATSYARGDIISISGKIKTPTSIVRLAITNSANQEIWSETLNVKNDGMFSTLVIAGGNGWEQSGRYTVVATYSGTTDTKTFDFTATPSN